MWDAKFRRDLPVSGEAPEVHFQAPVAHLAAWLWVEFTSAAGDRWFGCFRAGPLRAAKIAIVDVRHVFVLAAGAWYFVDADRKGLTSASGDYAYYADMIAIPDSGQVAIADFNRVTIVAPGGEVWTTPRVAMDGVRFISATRSVVSGVAESGHGPRDDRPFEIDLESRTVSGGNVDDF